MLTSYIHNILTIPNLMGPPPGYPPPPDFVMVGYSNDKLEQALISCGAKYTMSDNVLGKDCRQIISPIL